MPSSIGSTPRTRNAWQAALRQSGISLTLLSMAWEGVQTQFAIIRAVDLRLRGTRRRLVGLTMQDGAGLGIGH